MKDNIRWSLVNTYLDNSDKLSEDIDELKSLHRKLDMVETRIEKRLAILDDVAETLEIPKGVNEIEYTSPFCEIPEFENRTVHVRHPENYREWVDEITGKKATKTVLETLADKELRAMKKAMY